MKCTNCKTTFELSNFQKNLLEQMRECNSQMAMLECPNCGFGFGVNPFTEQEDELKEIKVFLRSPISGSHGVVVSLGNGKFGDGESGVFWENKEELYQDILKIRKMCSHRKGLYVKKGEDWVPVDVEPDNIDNLIDNEDI